MFRSLRRRNFRLFLAGQLVSNLGTWMQNVALAWLVLQISHSPLDVGVVSAVQFVPSLAFSAYGGVVADRFAKRNLLLITQSGLAVAAAALAALDLSGFRPLWALYIVTFASGMFGALDMPARQAFVSEMVGLEDLPNAVGLNSAMFNLTRVGGPALGALVIDVAGVGDCFALNALSYLAVIGALVAMRPGELFAGRRAAACQGPGPRGFQVHNGHAAAAPDPRLAGRTGHARLQFQHRAAGAWRKSTSGGTPAPTPSCSWPSASGRCSARSPPHTASARGCWSSSGPPGPWVLRCWRPRSSGTWQSKSWCWSLLGFASMLYLATSNATCQLASAPEMRGRVMGVYAMIFVGSTPVGAMLVGLVDQELGARWGLAVGGAPALIAAVRPGRVAGTSSGPRRLAEGAGAVLRAAAPVPALN